MESITRFDPVNERYGDFASTTFRETLWELGIRKVHNIAQFLLGDGDSLGERILPGGSSHA
jgi:hypothetical protein